MAEKQTGAAVLDDEAAEKQTALNNLDSLIPDEAAAAGSDSPSVTVTDNAEENLFGLLQLVPIGLNFAGSPKAAGVWSADACRGLSSACVPVFRKYGWGQRIIEFLNTGAGVEEMALAAVAFPIGLATYNGFMMDKAAQKTEQKTEQQAAQNMPGTKGSFEVARSEGGAPINGIDSGYPKIDAGALGL